ncbi:MAG: VOC family protein [Chloroflexi bacterium]|nr:VOC family protein [Chloroflexota bacterium]
MIIGLSGVFVEDQAKALAFYTEVLGFQLKHDMPVGDGNRWLTVVSPERPDGVELLLEPNSNPIASTFQQGLREENIPATSFQTSDIAAEHERLVAAGVVFTMPPTDIGPAIIAVFDDTCGNLINLMQAKA